MLWQTPSPPRWRGTNRGPISQDWRFIRQRSSPHFVKSHVFDPADFVIRTNGVCRLNPNMTRLVVKVLK
jgi:hypothetical protein